MTLVEKQQLQKMIQELPPRNLERVVEIIRRNKPIDRYSRDEIHVDLEKEVFHSYYSFRVYDVQNWNGFFFKRKFSQ